MSSEDWRSKPIMDHEMFFSREKLERLRTHFSDRHVSTVGDLASFEDYELLRVPGIGHVSLRRIREFIEVEKFERHPSVAIAPTVIGEGAPHAGVPGPDIDLLFTDKESAALLTISIATFHRRVADGTVPRPIKIGKLSRWPRSEIVAVIRRALAQRDASS